MYQVFNNQCEIKKVTQISSSCSIQTLPESNSDENSFIETAPRIQSLSSDLCYAWSAKGPRLEVVDARTGDRIASWIFGNVLRDKKTRITCICELPHHKFESLLLVGLECELTGGMVCAFNVRGSKVLKAFHLKDKVSSIHVVSSASESLPGILKSFDGAIAVGTVGGEIYLIDLSPHLWENSINPELNPSELITRTLETANYLEFENIKSNISEHGDHLALELNGGTHPDFILWTTDGGVALKYPRDLVHVSSLLFVPKLLSLFVGYNFGAWQIYNLLTLELEYTSARYKDAIPISHFAYQEPSDDPRAYCYIWTIYSGTNYCERQCVPFAAMYALSYEAKTKTNDFGVLYQKFNSCSLRFQMDLDPLSDQENSSLNGGICVSLKSYVNTTNSSSSETSSNPRLALAMIVWNSWYDFSLTPHTFMAVFDLDQWYKEQMPPSLRNRGNDSFIIHFDITKLLSHSKDSVQDIKMDVSTLSSFSATQRLEEHYYPSALTFDFICFLNNSVNFVKNFGLQRYLLLNLEQNGVEGFLEPHPLAHQCKEAGLQPISSDVTPRNTSAIDYLLSIALEHSLTRLLTACARTWATGVYASAGCTLTLFVNWATQRAEMLQTKANSLCVSLFDYSDIPLDCNAKRLLNQCTKQIRLLSIIFGAIAKDYDGVLSTPVLNDINDHYDALKMVSCYFNVLQWLLNVGLLPEAPLSTFENMKNSNIVRAPYLSDDLDFYYRNRRCELNELSENNRGTENSRSCELLFIDSFIENECGGEKLRKEWRCDNDDSSNGLYPPKSLQTLLRTYLVDGIDIKHKHTILLYLFFDLADLFNKTRYSALVPYLIKFPSVFQIPLSTMKITQAFWYLDHGDFNLAMKLFLDPLIKSNEFAEIQPWQHKLVFSVLQLYDLPSYAVSYLNNRSPPMVTKDEIMKGIQILLANNMIHAAFDFQRKCINHNHYEKILHSFFEECLKLRERALAVIKLQLNEKEEEVLFNILKSRRIPGINLLFTYYIQRNRIFEAMHTLSQENENDPALRLPNMQMKIFMNSIPKVSKSVFAYCQNNGNWTEAPKPQRKNITVQPIDNKIQYKSNIIAESIFKTHQLWKSSDNAKPYIKNAKDIEKIPFICTPKKIFNNQLEQKINTISIDSFSQNIKKRSVDDEEESNERSNKRRKVDTCKNPIALEKLMLTPIVKRSFQTSYSSMITSTPQSILKLRNKTNQRLEEIHKQDDLKEEEMELDLDDSMTPPAQKSQSSKVHFVEMQKTFSSEGSESKTKETPEELSPASTPDNISDSEENHPKLKDQISKVGSQEIDIISKKLQTGQIQKRKSLQQSILEQSLAKNVLPVLHQNLRQSQVLDVSCSQHSLSQRDSILDSTYVDNVSLGEDVLKKYGLQRHDLLSTPQKQKSFKEADVDNSGFSEDFDNSDFLLSKSICKKYGLYQSDKSDTFAAHEDHSGVISEIEVTNEAVQPTPEKPKSLEETDVDNSGCISEDFDNSDYLLSKSICKKYGLYNSANITEHEESAEVIPEFEIPNEEQPTQKKQKSLEENIEKCDTSALINEKRDINESKVNEDIEILLNRAKENVSVSTTETKPKTLSEVDIYENLDNIEENIAEMTYEIPVSYDHENSGSNKSDKSFKEEKNDVGYDTSSFFDEGSDLSESKIKEGIEIILNRAKETAPVAKLAEISETKPDTSNKVDVDENLDNVQEKDSEINYEMPIYSVDDSSSSRKGSSTSGDEEIEDETSVSQSNSSGSEDRESNISEDKSSFETDGNESMEPLIYDDNSNSNISELTGKKPQAGVEIVSYEPQQVDFASEIQPVQQNIGVDMELPLQIFASEEIVIPKLHLNESSLISEDESDLSALQTSVVSQDEIIKEEKQTIATKEVNPETSLKTESSSQMLTEKVAELTEEPIKLSEETIKPAKELPKSAEETTKSPEQPSKPCLRRPRKAASVTTSQPKPCKVYRTRSLDQSATSVNQTKPEEVTPVKQTPTRRKSATEDKKSDISTIEQYSSTRRLTRLQKSLLSQSMNFSLENHTLQSIRESDSEESVLEMRGPDLEPIDPIQLLDKSHFSGLPDPDEIKMLDRSPTSTIKTTSSIISESTSSRVGRRSQKSVEASPISIPTRQRGRKKSVDEKIESTRVTRRSSTSSKISIDEEPITSSKTSQHLTTPKSSSKRGSKPKQESSEDEKKPSPKRERSRSAEKEPKNTKKQRETCAKSNLSPIKEIQIETTSTKTPSSRSKRSSVSETPLQPVRKSSRLSNRSRSIDPN